MAGSSSENGVKGFEFRKADSRTKWQTFKDAIYKPSTKQFLGRTGKSWAQILFFYTLFYAGLAALFAVCMQGLLATLDDKKPTYTLDSGLIGTNPGLGFRPISSKTEEGSLIWYEPRNKTTTEKWVNLTEQFLQPYRRSQVGKNFENCDFNKPAGDDKVCAVNLEEFGNCHLNTSFGYNGASPCIFLKLNKIYGWVPKYYEEPSSEMQAYSKDLADLVKKNGKNKQYVWVSCKGENPVDIENAVNFTYYPTQGFPSYYFPYTNNENYLSPLVAVQIINPTPNVTISIECRAWAKNINYRGGNLQREGSVHFEIMHDA